MAEPNSFLESEFLEALVSHKNSDHEPSTKLKKIWLKMRKEVPTDSSFFDFPNGVSSSNLKNSGSGDCIIMSLDDAGKHLGILLTKKNYLLLFRTKKYLFIFSGWARQSCDETAYILCETKETLHQTHQPYVKSPEALFSFRYY